MPAPMLDESLLHEAVQAARAHGGVSQAAAALGMARMAVQHRLAEARRRLGLDWRAEPSAPAAAQDHPRAALDSLRALLRRDRRTLDELAEAMQVSRGTVVDMIDALRAEHVAVRAQGDHYWLDSQPQAATDAGRVLEYASRPDGTYVFGFLSDNHIGSKYARLDVLRDLFRHFERVGVDRVLNAGNWIDGVASFNRHDLVAHGMDAQVKLLVKEWPQIAGVTTYAVTGDDHEGWFSQREGVDIGAYAQDAFRRAGREDWVDLGFMEADIRLVNAGTGASAKLRVAHPGGGSAYATSYTVQKYIESLDGGDKPAVVLLGHYHKIEFLNVRNVWAIQTGCTQDQTPFGRKKRLDFHVGGGICRLTQDPQTGAIVSCCVEFFRYFNRDYYERTGDRWSHHGDVKMLDRVRA